jgi:hypothetical protein
VPVLVLQAIFLHYIGVEWSVFFKTAFTTLRTSSWSSNHTTVPKEDRLRRQYYLGPQEGSIRSNIEDTRASKYEQQYFSYQLLDHKTQKVEVAEGEEEAEHDAFRDQFIVEDEDIDFDCDPESESEESYRAPSKKPMQAKQDLLHMLSTEIILNTRLHGEFTCFRSVFESWNPLLPHDTILTVLEFLGVSKKWLTFFKTCTYP